MQHEDVMAEAERFMREATRGLLTVPRGVREYGEQAGLLWTRAERRRLGRGGSGPGRRRARRVSRVRLGLLGGFTRSDVARLTVLAAPCIGPDDVRVRSPAPGRAVVEIGGPGATAEALASVSAVLRMHQPVGLDLCVMGVPVATVEALDLEELSRLEVEVVATIECVDWA